MWKTGSAGRRLLRDASFHFHFTEAEYKEFSFGMGLFCCLDVYMCVGDDVGMCRCVLVMMLGCVGVCW